MVKLKLRWQILLGYLIIVLIFAGCVAWVNIKILNLISIIQKMEDAHTIVEKAYALAYQSAKAQRSMRGYLLIKNETSYKSWNGVIQEIDETTEALNGLIIDSKCKEILKKIIAVNSEFKIIGNELMLLVHADKQAEAFEKFKISALDEGREFDRLAIELLAQEKKLLTWYEKEENAVTNNICKFILLVCFVVILFTAVIAILLSSKIVRNMNKVIVALSSITAELAAMVAQHERAAAEQATSVNETKVSMEEINKISTQSAQQAESVAVIAKQAFVTTEDGIKLANQAYSGMNNLKDKVAAIGEQILRLSEQTGQIGNIAGIVTDIASQINMLALNAAVEAVRAGEQGKGFSVIAQEVRKLADQGKKSAEKVSGIVVEIQKATNSAIMVTEEGTKTSEQVTDIAKKAGESFSSLSDIANNVYENAKQVALNSKQQLTGINQVSSAMAEIAGGTKQTSSGITQTKVAIQNLNEIAKSLKDSV